MKCDQIAIYFSDEKQAEAFKAMLGLADKEWIKDTVTARSIVLGREGTNVAELQFNYDLGLELELLRYVDGTNWHDFNLLNHDRPGHTGGFISHVGFHLDDDEPMPELPLRLVQETFTLSHTAEYLTNPASPGYGRHYHYRIYELSPGSYIKYIKRIHPEAK